MSARRAQLSKQAAERWNKMFEAQARRMERQKETITRMGFMLTESIAALSEIAAMTPEEGVAGDSAAQDRAKQALDLIEEMRVRDEAAAEAEPKEE